MIRAVADALTGTAYRDDSQIVEILASKVYADSTYIEVTDEDLSPQVEAFRSTVPAGLGVNTPKDTGKG